MQREAVYDLLVARPHEPPESRIEPADWDAYRTGYEWALIMALRTMDHAERRYKMYLATRRLDTLRKRGT